MSRSRYTRLLLALFVAALSLLWSTQVLAAQRLQMWTEPSVPGSATTLIVSYEGDPAFVAADLVLTLTDGLAVSETSGRLGTGLYTSDWSWDEYSREVRISLNSADLFSGHIAEIPLTVHSGGGYIELQLLSAYNDLILNITDDLAVDPVFLQVTASGTSVVDSIPDEQDPVESSHSSESTTRETDQVAPTGEDPSIGNPSEASEEPATETDELANTPVPSASEADTGSDLAPEEQNTASQTDPDRTQADDSLVESSQASEQITGHSDLDALPNSTAWNAGGGVTSMETSEQPLAPSDPDSEEGDINSGHLATQLNRILRVLVIVLLIAVAAVLIVLLIQYQRRRR